MQQKYELIPVVAVSLFAFILTMFLLAQDRRKRISLVKSVAHWPTISHGGGRLHVECDGEAYCNDPFVFLVEGRDPAQFHGGKFANTSASGNMANRPGWFSAIIIADAHGNSRPLIFPGVTGLPEALKCATNEADGPNVRNIVFS